MYNIIIVLRIGIKQKQLLFLFEEKFKLFIYTQIFICFWVGSMSKIFIL